MKPRSDIKAIPTVYNHRQYRSRLEARWACVFDLLGWKFEYEPYDCPGWIPDFLLKTRIPILVEVKPVITFPEDVAKEIEEALPPDHEALILGCTIPVMDHKQIYPDNFMFGWHLGATKVFPGNRSRKTHLIVPPQIIWTGKDNRWNPACFGRWKRGEGRIGFSPNGGEPHDRITGGYDGENGGSLDLEMLEIEALWAYAGNLVQWRGEQSIVS